MNEKIEMAIAAILLGATAVSASAQGNPATQRDPQYQAARTDGLIGEKEDGYLGFVVTPPSPAIKALVQDINIKRLAANTKQLAAEGNSGATVESLAFRNGCRQIGERLAVGEKYQAPDGSWATKGDSPALLSPNCPK